MGMVYRALDRLTGQQVALKFVTAPASQLSMDSQIPPSETESHHRLALAQEFRILASLHHPNIIHVLDYGFGQESQPYFSMEYLPGAQTLTQAAQSVSLEARVDLLCQVLQALAYLHRQGILHRDLKPGNILVRDGRARVLDFGLSSNAALAHGRAGTLAYMAPEILRQGRALPASDLYALGVLACQVLGGELPFEGQDPAAILTRLPKLDSLAEWPALRQWVATLLEKEPANRYPDAQTALAALTGAVGLPLPQEERAIRESYLRAAQFVGREEEITRLMHAWERASQGQGSLWLVDGESGVGKSRLLEDLRIRALVHGALVIRGQAAAESGSRYHLWHEPLRQAAVSSSFSDLQAGVLASIVPDLAALLGRPVQPPDALTGTAEIQRLELAIADVFQAAAPLLLILEDLHWATDGLEPLRILGRVVEQLPILVVGSYRTDEAPALADSFPGAEHLSLNRLDARQIALLSQTMLGPAGAQPEVVDWLARETEGNIFFLVETVRALAEEAGRLDRVGQKELPFSLLTQGVRQVLLRRIQRMPAGGRRLLTLAAIAGRVLDLTLLSALDPGIRIEHWLMSGANLLILETRDGYWQFAHDKLRETILQEISPEERPGLYQSVADASEYLYPADPEWAASLAGWWKVAGRPEKEFSSVRLAGKYAIAQQSYARAEGFILRALALCPEDDWNERYELYLDLEKIYSETEKHEQQGQALTSLESFAEQLAPTRQLNIQLLRAGYERALQNFGSALGILMKIAPQAASLHEDQVSVVIEREWGIILSRQTAYREALIHLERALALSEKIGDLREQAQVLGAMSMLYFDLGDSRSAALNNRAMEIFQMLGDHTSLARTLINRGNDYDEKGESELALADYAEALRILRKTGYPSGEALALANQGFVYERLGDYEKAFQNDLRAWQILIRIGNLEWAVGPLTNLASVCFSQKKMPQAYEYAAQAVQVSQAVGGTRLEIPARVMQGHILVSLKQWDAAIEAFQLAQTHCELTGYSRIRADLEHGWVRLALAQGDLNAACRSMEQILQLRETDPALSGVSDEPMRIFSTCCYILIMTKDARAQDLLSFAYQRLQNQSMKISDPQLRQSYLERVPANCEIARLWRSLHSKVLEANP